MSKTKKKYDRAYYDPSGTGAYWRDPSSDKISFKDATRQMMKKPNKGSKGYTPGAMEIYENWMEPGGEAMTFKRNPKPETPIQSSRPQTRR